MSGQLLALAEPFPDKFIHKNPSGGGTYVKHHVVTQRLLYVLGAHSFEMVEIVRGDVAALPPNPQGKSEKAKAGSAPLSGVVVAVIARLRVVVDGRPVTVEEAGDCEQPHQWDTDGARLKDAMSDAYKRCAMRLGCGLHLWSQNEYFLQELLAQVSGGEQPAQPIATAQAPPEDAGEAGATGRESSLAGGSTETPSTEAPADQLEGSAGDADGDGGVGEKVESGSADTHGEPERPESPPDFTFGSGKYAGHTCSTVARAAPTYLRSFLPSLTPEQREIAEFWLRFHAEAVSV